MKIYLILSHKQEFLNIAECWIDIMYPGATCNDFTYNKTQEIVEILDCKFIWGNKDNPETLRGYNFSGVWIDQKVDEDILYSIIMPACFSISKEKFLDYGPYKLFKDRK